MSHEIELKFGFPPDARDTIAAALAAAGATRERLQAHYVDTPDRRLARHRIALRLRQEGERWVQTLKAAGTNIAHRLEHNAEVAAPAGGGVPALDVSRHDGSEAGDALRRVFDADPAGAAALQPVYGTDLWRTRAVVGVAGARIEAALDEGWIVAGAQRQAVCELEIELLDGDAAALAALTADWLPRHRLWLSHATKAERGERLAQRLPAWPVVKTPERGAGREAVVQALAQAVPNADALAAGHGTPAHAAALGAALRRLLALQSGAAEPALAAALSALDRGDDAAGAAAAPALQQALVRLTVAALPGA